MARRSQFPSRSAVPRRSSAWLTGPALLPNSVSAVVNTIWDTGLQILEDGVTLIRTRGEMLVRLTTTAGGTTDGIKGAAGIAIASENAFGQSGAMMDPFADSEWDGWIWHSFYHLSGPAGSVGAAQRLSIDSKAMRKISALDVLYGAVSLGLETGVEVQYSTADTRMLFKVL